MHAQTTCTHTQIHARTQKLTPRIAPINFDGQCTCASRFLTACVGWLVGVCVRCSFFGAPRYFRPTSKNRSVVFKSFSKRARPCASSWTIFASICCLIGFFPSLSFAEKSDQLADIGLERRIAVLQSSAQENAFEIGMLQSLAHAL